MRFHLVTVAALGVLAVTVTVAQQVGGSGPGAQQVIQSGSPPSAPPSAISPSTSGDPALDVDGVNRLAVGRFPTPPFAPDGRMMAYPVTWYPGTPTINSAMPIDLEHGADRSGLDVRLQPVPAARISGIVQGAFQNLTLRLLPAGSESLGLGSEAATALVAGDGSW